MRVLVVDDDRMVAELMAELLLMEAGASVLLAPDGAAALNACSEFRPDVILLDIGLPDVTGPKLISLMQTYCPMARIIVISGYDAGQGVELVPPELLRLVKPVEFDILRQHIFCTDHGSLAA